MTGLTGVIGPPPTTTFGTGLVLAFNGEGATGGMAESIANRCEWDGNWSVCDCCREAATRLTLKATRWIDPRRVEVSLACLSMARDW